MDMAIGDEGDGGETLWPLDRAWPSSVDIDEGTPALLKPRGGGYRVSMIAQWLVCPNEEKSSTVREAKLRWAC